MRLSFFTFILITTLPFISIAQPKALKNSSAAYQSFQRGETQYIKGNFKVAVASFAKAEKAYGDNHDGKIIANALHSLALLQANKKEAAYFAFSEVGEKLLTSKTNIIPEAQLALDYCISRYHWAYQERQESLEALNKVKKNLNKKGLQLPIALDIEIYEFLGETEKHKGNNEKAKEYYLIAIAAAEKLKQDERNEETFAEDNLLIGELQEDLKEPDSALVTYQRILKYKAQIIPDDIEKEIELGYRIGKVYFKKKQYDEALSYLTDALKTINKTGQNKKRIAAIQTMMAAMYADKRQYLQAITYNVAALELWNKSFSNDDLEFVFLAELNQGLIYRKIAPSNGGTIWYKKTAKAGEEEWRTAFLNRKLDLIKPVEKTEKKIDFNLGLISYSNAEKLIAKYPKQQQVIKEIEVLMATGALLFEADAYPRAKQKYQKVLDLMAPIYDPKHPLIAEASRVLGECYLAEQLFAEALGFIDQSINASMEEGAEISGDATPDIGKTKFPFELLNAISSKGLVMSGLSAKKTEENLSAILKNYDVAIQLLNQLRKTHKNEGSKYRLSTVAHKFCQQAVITANTLYELSDKEKYLADAFKYAELSKSSVLLETIRDLKAKKIGGIPDELIQQENQLKVDIAYLKDEIFYELKQGKNKDAARILDLEEQSQIKKKEHIALLHKLEKEYPSYYTMKYDYKVKSIPNLQAKLNPNESFLEYVVTDSFVYVIAINKDKILTQYTPVKELAKTVSLFKKTITARNSTQYLRLGLDLFHIVLNEKVIKHIAGNKLIIAADAELNYIPFGVLPTRNSQKEGNQIYPDLEFLIEKHAISYSYSANLFLLYNSEKIAQQGKENISLWAPTFSSMVPTLQAKGIADSLAELPGAVEEAEYISSLFGGTIQVGEAASELAFKKAAQKYSVLHIATHGILNDSDPLFSNLVMTAEGDEDGLLHTYELFNMSINADMVVLSACNSGIGQLTKGEGVISIARGFAYAGVPNIVMSTWQVSDFTTKIIMSSFYTNLKNGLPKDEAMQKAKVDFINTYEKDDYVIAPFYWGPFIVVGNTEKSEALYMPSNNYYWVLGIVGILLLVIIGLLIKKRKTT